MQGLFLLSERRNTKLKILWAFEGIWTAPAARPWPLPYQGSTQKSLSFWGDLNPWPLPYQGSALPLSYKSIVTKSIVLRTKKRLAKVIYWMFSLIASMMLLIERKTRFELATYSLEGYRSTSWATSAFVFVFTSKTGLIWSISQTQTVGADGFEPPKT